MPQKTKAEIAAEKAALKASNEAAFLENEIDRDLASVVKDPNPFELKPKKRSKGGEPIKAVLGVAVLGTKKGRDTLKKFFKGKKEVLSSAPGMAAVPRTMNKGGGMDMGHKPRPRGNPGIVENVVGKGGDYIKDLID